MSNGLIEKGGWGKTENNSMTGSYSPNLGGPVSADPTSQSLQVGTAGGVTRQELGPWQERLSSRAGATKETPPFPKVSHGAKWQGNARALRFAALPPSCSASIPQASLEARRQGSLHVALSAVQSEEIRADVRGCAHALRCPPPCFHAFCLMTLKSLLLNGQFLFPHHESGPRYVTCIGPKSGTE